jgi:hypothetical protein
MASHGKIVGYDKSRGRHQCLSPLCSLLLPSVQNLFGCFCGRGAWLLAWRFDKPRVGHDKSRCRHQCESSASVPFVPFATFCSKPLRLLLWARRLAFGVAIDKPRVGHDKSRCRHQCESSKCPSPLRSLCYLLFKTSSVASVGGALGFWRDDR